MAFFSGAAYTKKPPASMLPKCGACGLLTKCRTPQMAVSGKGKSGILIVTDAPNENDDRNGRLLDDEVGSVLERFLRSRDIDLRTDCWLTSALICKPDGAYSVSEIEYCRPNLIRTCKELQPRQILLLGPAATRSYVSQAWREDIGKHDTWIGWNIPSQRDNCWVTPLHSPYSVYGHSDKREWPVVRVWFERYLDQALKLSGRPWGIVPDYRSDVRLIYDPNEAAAWIRDKIKAGGPASFDYETDRLKPDSADAHIVCCSICWRGSETISFPWVGEAIAATSEFLKSDMPKIGCNTKFEDRWTRAKLGHPVNKVVHDTMLSAHHLDNRGNISSIKFQAYVKLGFAPWDDAIKPYLEADDANSKNRINEIDLHHLLQYCGIDSLVEYLVAEIQKKELKYGPLP